MRWHVTWRRSLAWSVIAVMMGLSAPSGSARVGRRKPQDSAPTMREPASALVHDWLEQEHAFLRRYQMVVRQGAHDYRYGYRTPTLLLPVTLDLFTGCVVHHYLMEEQFLYPVLRPHMPAERQKLLDLVTHDQQTENDTIKGLERKLARHQPGASLEDEADSLDYLEQMTRRHMVFHEEQLYPVVETLTSKEQEAILEGITRYGRETFGSASLSAPPAGGAQAGRQRYEQLLAYMEEEIKRIAGRVW